jgi:hypothetical protein
MSSLKRKRNLLDDKQKREIISCPKENPKLTQQIADNLTIKCDLFILMSLYKCKMYVSRVETIWESLSFHLITWLPVFNVPQFITKLVIPPNYQLHRRWRFNEGALKSTNNYITSVFHWNFTIWLVMKWSHDYKRDVLHPNKTQTRTCTCLHDDVRCRQSMA